MKRAMLATSPLMVNVSMQCRKILMYSGRVDLIKGDGGNLELHMLQMTVSGTRRNESPAMF